MNPIQENPALNAELTRIAQTHVDSARQQYALTFDYSEASLGWIDDVVTRHHAGGAAPDNTVLGFGAYVGETIRRLLGGTWVQDERGVALLQGVAGRELSASPFSWVQSRFQGGPAHSVAGKFVELKQQAGDAGAAQPITAEENEMLARAPLLVFLLVAAADGKVDKKELASFGQILDADLRKAPPLFRTVMSATLENLDRFLEELQGRDPVEDLERVRSILDSHYPQDAQVFKEILMAIGFKIASSSGGFFGLGSKISKDEKMALGGIAATLGLIGDDENAGEGQ